jgi:hypothetical protein
MICTLYIHQWEMSVSAIPVTVSSSLSFRVKVRDQSLDLCFSRRCYQVPAPHLYRLAGVNDCVLDNVCVFPRIWDKTTCLRMSVFAVQPSTFLTSTSGFLRVPRIPRVLNLPRLRALGRLHVLLHELEAHAALVDCARHLQPPLLPRYAVVRPGPHPPGNVHVGLSRGRVVPLGSAVLVASRYGKP